MQRAPVTRLSLMLAATIAIAAAACAGDASVAGPGTRADKSPTAAPGDTFSLSVHVGTGAPGADGVPGATVAISKTVWTFITHGTGHDTAAGHQVDVSQGATDANGDITFRNLPADVYHVQADAPQGSGLSSGWIVADLLTTREVRAAVILKRAP